MRRAVGVAPQEPFLFSDTVAGNIGFGLDLPADTAPARARIAEAEHQGWLGEVEGLKVSLAGARQKLADIDQRATRGATVELGMPDFSHVTGCNITTSDRPTQDKKPS